MARKVGKNFEIPVDLLAKLDDWVDRAEAEHRVVAKWTDVGTAALVAFLELPWEQQRILLGKARNYDLEAAATRQTAQETAAESVTRTAKKQRRHEARKGGQSKAG